MMDKNSVDYAFQMFYDFCSMSDEELKEKYPDEPEKFSHPVHGKQVGTWDGDAYHHPCPVYEDGYIDYSWGYMGD